MGNRLSMTTPEGTITYTYDAADRLLSISDGTTFTWDDNGNMLSKGSTTYAYDAANRLIQVSDGTTLVQFTYDGDGKRVSKVVNGATTSYLYDVNTTLPVVLIESGDGGDILYTYGADLIAMTDPGGAQSYYHYDGLGSVRNLSDGTGAMIASYTYGAFGDLRMMKGSSDNAFKFTGEQTDDETGLIYLRARYYDPSVGRFTTRDPFPGFIADPQSLNDYAYASNNPIKYVDPSGEFLATAAAGAGIGATVNGIFYGAQVLLTDETWNWSKFGGELAGGAIAGGLAGATAGAPLIAHVGFSAMGGALGKVVEKVISGEEIKGTEVAEAAIESGVTAGVARGIVNRLVKVSGVPGLPGRNPTTFGGYINPFKKYPVKYGTHAGLHWARSFAENSWEWFTEELYRQLVPPVYAPEVYEVTGRDWVDEHMLGITPLPSPGSAK